MKREGYQNWGCVKAIKIKKKKKKQPESNANNLHRDYLHYPEKLSEHLPTQTLLWFNEIIVINTENNKTLQNVTLRVIKALISLIARSPGNIDRKGVSGRVYGVTSGNKEIFFLETQLKLNQTQPSPSLDQRVQLAALRVSSLWWCLAALLLWEIASKIFTFSAGLYTSGPGYLIKLGPRFKAFFTTLWWG